MTLRPARRRRYALSQYATVRGFLFGSKNGLVSFFLGAVGVRLTLSISRRFSGRLYDLLGGSARMDIRMSRAIALSFIPRSSHLLGVSIFNVKKQRQRTTRPNRPTSRDGLPIQFSHVISSLSSFNYHNIPSRR